MKLYGLLLCVLGDVVFIDEGGVVEDCVGVLDGS